MKTLNSIREQSPAFPVCTKTTDVTNARVAGIAFVVLQFVNVSGRLPE